MRWLLLLALLPSVALAQGPRIVSGAGTFQSGPRILGEPAFAFELDALTQDEATRPGWPVTTTRASTRMCFTGTTWQTVPADTPCIGRYGLVSFGPGTNYWTNSTSPELWNPEATPIVTPQPDGSFLVEDDNTDAFEGLRSPSVAAAVGETWTVTCEVKRATALTFRLAVEAANPCTLLSVPTEWTRVSCTRTLTGSTARGAFYPADNGSGDTGGTYVRQCQLEKASTPGPRHDCGASACSWQADVHRVDASAWPTGPFRVRLQYTPLATIASTATGTWDLLDTRLLGTGVRVYISNGALAFNVNDGATVQVTGPKRNWIGGTTYEIDAELAGGTLTTKVDGVVAATGAGPASITHSLGANATIGSRGDGTSFANGHIRLLRVSQ